MITLAQMNQVIVIAESGSMNVAASRLFVSQPGLSQTVREVEKELGITLFVRSNRGITLTPEGSEFIGYARNVLQQVELMEDRYRGRERKRHFSVSTQHYSFAVRAFVETVRETGMERFEYACHETKTSEVISNVRNMVSEIGVLYLSDFNEAVLRKLFAESGLTFTELFQSGTYVYLWKDHPLAEREIISLEDLEAYPCLVFEQGENNSFYFAEEMKSAYAYPKIIRADDRATMLNLMVGLSAYTLCSGLISEDLNGTGYRAVPLKESETIRIGCITRKDRGLSDIGELYLDKLKAIGEEEIRLRALPAESGDTEGRRN